MGLMVRAYARRRKLTGLSADVAEILSKTQEGDIIYCDMAMDDFYRMVDSFGDLLQKRDPKFDKKAFEAKVYDYGAEEE